MLDDELDPGANTEMFQAFVDRDDEPVESASRWIWTAVAVGALVIVLTIAWLMLGG